MGTRSFQRPRISFSPEAVNPDEHAAQPILLPSPPRAKPLFVSIRAPRVFPTCTLECMPRSSRWWGRRFGCAREETRCFQLLSASSLQLSGCMTKRSWLCDSSDAHVRKLTPLICSTTVRTCNNGVDNENWTERLLTMSGCRSCEISATAGATNLV